MNTKDRKAKSELGVSSLVNENSPLVQPPGVSTLPSTDPSSGDSKIDIHSILTDYHLTVQLKVHLERRQVSLLLDVLNYQAVYFGVNFQMYVSMLHLYEILLGNKLKASEIKDKYERRTALVCQTIIRDLAGKELSFVEYLRVTGQTKKLILDSKALMGKDIYKSRLIHWRPERLLSLKTVPVDVKISRNGNSIRYSSYCKGYGEGSGTARTGRTRQCFELDGEETQDFILGRELLEQDLRQELFLIAHFEWLKRFGTET